MRTIDSSTLAINSSGAARWRSGWTGRLVLAALLFAAAAAFALLPNNAGAQALTIEGHYCKANAATGGDAPPEERDATNGVIPADDWNTSLKADCIALLTATQSLLVDDGNDSTTDDPPITAAAAWAGLSVSIFDDGDDTTTDVNRIATVTLSNSNLKGPLHADWAKLTAMSSLNLSSNMLTGSLPSGWDTGFDSLRVPGPWQQQPERGNRPQRLGVSDGYPRHGRKRPESARRHQYY